MKSYLQIPALLISVIAASLVVACASKEPQPEKAAAATPTKATKNLADENGTKVTGINGKEGEIVGKPAKNSKFTSLQMGMAIKQVTDIVGQPTDQGAYITGKAFIPFYFGDDKHRYEMAYKGQGRLIFAGQAFGGGAYLIKIVHDANDSGYRN
jgi:hypothetical protein